MRACDPLDERMATENEGYAQTKQAMGSKVVRYRMECLVDQNAFRTSRIAFAGVLHDALIDQRLKREIVDRKRTLAGRIDEHGKFMQHAVDGDDRSRRLAVRVDAVLFPSAIT